MLYVNKTGCQWRMLPKDFGPWETVYGYFRRWRRAGVWERVMTELRHLERRCQGRFAEPSAGAIDSQSVKTATQSQDVGFDRHKKIKGRKRHLLVDTLGLLIAVLITSARLDDGMAAPLLLGLITPAAFPRLITIFADQKYHNHTLDAWMAEHRVGWCIEVKTRPAGTRGFTPLEKRWVIERTNAWHGRYRRNSKDYERSTESSTTMIQISHIHLMLNRLSPCGRPAFHYRREAA